MPSIADRAALWIEQSGTCAWPPCSKYLCDLKDLDRLFRQKIHVDHNHRCCDDTRSCGKCVRGLVHAWCNTVDIKGMDRAIDRGFDPPLGAIRDYLLIGEVNCRGESYLESEEYVPVCESAEDSYLRESRYQTQDIELRDTYPLLTAQALDGLSIEEIRKQFKMTRRQVTYRLRLEKEAFINETADTDYSNRDSSNGSRTARPSGA